VDSAPSGTSRTSRPHAAARLEDRFNGLLSRVLGRRGWVPRVEPYTGYGSPGRVRILARALLAAPGTHADEAAERDRDAPRRTVRGWRSFLTAQVPGVTVTVVVGDRTHEVQADRGGYVDAVVESDLAPGWHEVTLSLGGESVSAPVVVLDPARRAALVSDIDDTIMVTALPRPLLAAWNSLVLHQNARRVVPGMAGLYRRWQQANPGAPAFYLSTGAWNVAPMVRRFIARHGYPVGPLLLTDWGPTNTGWFRSGQQHKLETLRRLIREFPEVRWVLVGDDGQHDPQIYRKIASEHPDHVELIAIRQLSPTEQMLAHGTPTPNEEDRLDTTGAARTVTGPDGNVLALRLIDAGLL
jgi:phosphatidate phosphatase APP1